ncbi:MAG TPA: S8 family serine peptidase, partial [Desulfuromonadaceae bacterium]|nr:S8 family serine peptidase [Desulfuromonadaceae bacterium]
MAFACLTAGGQTKSIRLRDGTVATPPRPAITTPQSTSRLSPSTASGLYLIQFESPATPDERAQLRAMGVRLLKYIPDDAFIARLDNVSPARVQALDFVRWMGAYDSGYKIAPSLSTLAGKAKIPGTVTNVTVLISPGAMAAEINGVKSIFSRIQHESDLRMGTVLRGELNLDRLSALAQSTAVLWVEPAPKHKLIDEAASKLVGGDDGGIATPTVTEQLGFDGSGVTVCVADTGLDTGDTNTMHPDLNGRVTGFQFYGDLADGSDGYGHGTHCAGIIGGNAATGETDPDTGQFYGLGVASGANLFVERIFDDNAGEADPFPSDETLTTDAVRAGAKIGSNSWGNDANGQYDTDAAAFDELVRDADPSTPGDQPYILEFSAGNAGGQSSTMDSPASAKNVIATGASENVAGTLALTYGLYADGPDTIADFSSRGPCEDGRIKPDVVAPGTWIASARSSAAVDEDSTAWSAIDGYYVYMGGTSMAGPHAAGAAAVFVQYYKSLHAGSIPSPALVKAALINSAEALDDANGGPGPAPNFDEGWGRVTLTNLITTSIDTASRSFQFFDQAALLTTGQTYEQHALVRGSGQPLKITLAYTDVAGFPGAIPALVNDLDLEVIAPDGTLYRGNQFVGNESVPNASSPDEINNVEGVYLPNPAPGDYLVRVRARNVAEDARLDTAQVDQDFALVASGDLARPGSGNILLDRASYTAPGIIRIEVFDLARAASNTVTASIKSTTEPSGETILLKSAGNYGAFTGAVSTLVGSAVADGKLEIHNGDAIEADYTDKFGNLRTAAATADLGPPVISNVSATTDLGVTAITWQTGEPADSKVRYGTNSLNLNLSMTNSAMVTNHSLKLSRLVPGRTYYYAVTSSDAAGNNVTNNNGGALYNFVAVATPTVLLVDDYDAAGEENVGSPVIPDSAYTNALAASGFSYAHWKVLARGSPALADLRPYPVVIWRTTDDLVNYGYDPDGFPDPSATNNTLNAQQQFVLQNYLNGGGSFLMASMNILENIGNVSFRRNGLHVGGFKDNPDPPSPCDSCDQDYGVPQFFGGAGDPLAGGMFVTLNYSNYPSFDVGDGTVFGPDFSDTFTPTANATAICFESGSAKPCGLSYPRVGQDSAGRVVFFSFPLDTMPTNLAAPNNEVTLLRNALQFLAPGANGNGVISLDKSTYSVPAQVTVEVGDSDRIGAGSMAVTVSNRSSGARLSVTLDETTHPGLFRGSFTLVSSGAATNQLAAAGGNIIAAIYFDASRGSNVVATATVDTVAPVITNVVAVADITSATVSWTTSEPSDSLVQYGESAFPSHTVSSPKMATNHVVTLTGLLADRVYYFQVTSRDAAGNSDVDDNGGA